jgi:hypothetical protein
VFNFSTFIVKASTTTKPDGSFAFENNPSRAWGDPRGFRSGFISPRRPALFVKVTDAGDICADHGAIWIEEPIADRLENIATAAPITASRQPGCAGDFSTHGDAMFSNYGPGALLVNDTRLYDLAADSGQNSPLWRRSCSPLEFSAMN